jgi:pimeloyl-ACP methyl ester carboxylesterase
MEIFISEGVELEYEVYGSGKKVMLAFHGFGNQASDFKILETSVGRTHRIIAFNLPFHGASRFHVNRKNQSPSKKEFKIIFQKFLEKNNIDHFSVMGFSLGGKIALQLTEFFPDKIDLVLLFAPDGLMHTGLIEFAAGNPLGRIFFKRIVHDPSGFLKLLQFVQRSGIIDKKLIDFVEYSLRCSVRRQQLWNVWNCFRHIHPDITEIQKLMNKNSITIHLFFGRYDNVIPPSAGKSFAKKLKQQNTIHILDTGHHMLTKKLNDYLLKNKLT